MDAATAFRPLKVEELAPPAPEPTSASEKTPIIPVPDGAPPCRYRHPEHGAPVGLWVYRDADKRLIGYAARFDFARDDGRAAKEVLPLTFCDLGNGRRGWRAKAVPEPCPLYRLPGLLADPARPVLVVEGEKTADAAAELFPDHAVVTSMGGADAPALSDWRVLTGRAVVVWPDRDEAGTRYRLAVAALATEAGAASVRVVRVPGTWPEGWDLADPVPDGVRAEDLHLMREAAEAWSPMQDDPPTPCVVQWPYKLVRAGAVGTTPGVYLGEEREDKETDEPAVAWTWIASPIEVLADARDAASSNWGRLLEIETRDGHRHLWAMPMRLHAGSGEEFRARLYDLGATISPHGKHRHALGAYVQTWRPSRRVRCVDRVGWHGTMFVMPDESYGSADEAVILQADTSPVFERAGTPEGWRDEVARFAVGNSRLAFGIATAFTGPLLQHVGEESGGFHLKGGSSSGKSTILRCAASAWGCDPGSWRTTDNAAENTAAEANDGLLALDEIGQAPPRALAEIAYMLGNERGKARMRRETGARRPRRWRTTVLSTGEVGLAQKLAEAGLRAHAGQEVRFAEVPADAGQGHGAFEVLHGFTSGDALARHLRWAAEAHKGHAARAFLTKIAQDVGAVAEAVVGYRRRWLERNLAAGADGQVARVAGRFALVAAAGELATGLGGLPWPEGEAEQAAARCFAAWLAARGGGGPAELRDGLAQVRAFIEAHGSSRFEAAWPADVVKLTDASLQPEASIRKTVARAGFRRLEHDGAGDRWEYYVLPEAWRTEVCKGFDFRAISEEMQRRGWLHGQGTRLTQKPRVPGHGPTRVYVVTADFLSAEEADAATDDEGKPTA